jgi:XTP/dITP diphosphohydrolase
VLATANAAKARELAALLTGIPYRLRSLADFPHVTLPPEGADSYVENALGKARAVAAATGTLALADDSGIEVDALGGEGLSDAERCAKMLEALKGVLPLKRSARYRCVIAIAEPGGREVTTEGNVDGILLDERVGTGGFGYDPIFYYPPLDATFAQLGPDEKHAVSHRGIAMARARALLMDWRRAGAAS